MKRLIIPLSLVVAGAIVALAVFLVINKQQGPTGSGQGDITKLAPVAPADHILGNPTAPVKIIEYSDFDCSFCKQFDQVLHQAINDYGASGKVAWVYRNFPIVALHPNAFRHAEAAECIAQVAGNAAYWKFADSLFTNQPTDPVRYGQLAQAAGVDSFALSNCLANASTTVDARINADEKNALDIGALGTPYSIIIAPDLSPIILPGATSYANLKSSLDSILATTPK